MPALAPRPLWALALVAAVPILRAATARAYDAEVDLETIGQGYQVVAGDGTLLDRRRLDQYLGLHVWNLPSPSQKTRVYFTMSLRLDEEFGGGAAAAWAPSTGMLDGRDVRDQLQQNQLELLYAYLAADDVAGFVDVHVGRQIVVEPLQWSSFDGLSVDVKTPYHVGASAWGGLAVDGALPFDSPLYRVDGTSPGPLSVHDSDWKPTLGVALHSSGVRDLDARLSYVRIWSPAQSSTPDEKAVGALDGTTSEKLAWSARARLWDGRLVPWLSLRYDLLVSALDIAEAGARLVVAPGHTVELQYVYSYPTFDGDSIWNIFTRTGFDDVRLGYDVRHGRVSAYARALVRLFSDVDETTDRAGVPMRTAAPQPGSLADRLDWGGDLGARLDGARGWVRLDGYGELGYGGTRYGVDAAARARVLGERFSVEGRLTYAHWRDDLRAVASGDSVGAQLGARLDLAPGILVHLVGEDNVGTFYTSQLRFWAVVDVSFLMNGGLGLRGAPLVGVGSALGQFGSYGGSAAGRPPGWGF